MTANEFKPTGQELGKGANRTFQVVQLSDGSTAMELAATTPWENKGMYLRSAEYQLAQAIHAGGLTRANHRLVLPLAFQEGNMGDLKVYYPLVNNGRNLLDEVLASKFYSGVSYFPLKTVIKMGSDIATGLDIMHAHGFTHTDVKLSNILPENDRAYLADFNIAMFFPNYSVDRNQFLFLLQILLVGREVDRLFEHDPHLKSARINFLQGYPSLYNDPPVLATNPSLGQMMKSHYPASVVSAIHQSYRQPSTPLGECVSQIASLLL